MTTGTERDWGEERECQLLDHSDRAGQGADVTGDPQASLQGLAGVTRLSSNPPAGCTPSGSCHGLHPEPWGAQGVPIHLCTGLPKGSIAMAAFPWDEGVARPRVPALQGWHVLPDTPSCAARRE